MKNFSSDGEFATTGTIAAYADGATFENIAIFDCNPRVYNIGNGGIVGCVGWYAKEAGLKTTFKNITVDNSNKITALWGSWDVACGGIVGQYYPTSGQTSANKPANGGIHFENCHVSAQIDVYNDVCANYQYYAYRYAGILMGSVRENVTVDGYVYPKMDKITASGCTVHFGDWNVYYYCELVANSLASYTHDHQMSRLEKISSLDEIKSGNNWTKAGNFLLIDGNTKICYHIVNKDGVLTQHNHADAGEETVDGVTVLKEDKQIVCLPFNNLVTGYGWGVTSKGVEDMAGVTILDREEADSVEKFEGKVTTLANKKAYKLSDIFAFVDNGVELKPKALTVTVTNLDENNPVSATFKNDEKNWENGTLALTGTGKVTITIQDYYFCTPTTIEVTITERVAEEKFETKFTGDFLYRVGNQNAVKLDSLFKAKDGVTVGNNVSVTIVALNSTGASGTYKSNATWTNGTIQFSDTGVVKVTITDNDYCVPTELILEVVDAVNVTTATNATNNNVVLLNDCTFSDVEVSGGYALYGNGFTMTCGSDSASLTFGQFVKLDNGTLDNVQIVCPNYDYAALYNSQLTGKENRSETTDKTRYYNAKSAVLVTGNSQILNSRISGGRAALYASNGNIVVDNSRLEGGAVANVIIGAANSFVFRDTTLIQKPTASTYDSSKTLMGMSVLYLCDADGDATPTTIEGEFVQYAWADASCTAYMPAGTSDIANKVLKKTDYTHTVDGKTCVNLGFAYMPNEGTKVNKPSNITDKRDDKGNIPYAYEEVSATVPALVGSANISTYVYSYKNKNGTDTSFSTEKEYVPNKYSDIITVMYSDTADGLTTGKTFGTDGWVYELNVDLDKLSGYKLDFSKLCMRINGVEVTNFQVDGGAKPTAPISVTAGGVTYTLTATIDGKDYTTTYKVTGTETSKESPSKISGPTAAGFGVAKSYGGDWSGAADVLTGVKVKYWSVDEGKYVEFDFSNFTVPGNAGKLNGTNNYWEYTHTNNDFTLKVTNTVAIHSGKSVYGMPIRGTDGKLYFTISSTTGYVGTGTTSRAITMQYEFTDNNGGEKLTFTHTFNISYSKDEQYSYSDLSGSGKLTKLVASSGGGGCVTGDTMITLADGSTKMIKNVVAKDTLRVWNFYEGKYDYVPAATIINHGSEQWDVITLTFDDGTVVKAVTAHAFFDADLNKFVMITPENTQDYIGHAFAKEATNGYSTTKLISCKVEKKYTDSYSLVSALHYNFTTEGMFSLTNLVPNLIAGLEIGKNMKYDEVALKKDIVKYGLYTYADFAEYITEETFDAFNAQYIKISVGEGYITYEEIIDLIARFVNN